MRRTLARCILLAVAAVTTLVAGPVPRSAHAAVTWPGGDRVTIASGMTQPWGVAHLGDGTLLVSERDSGKVWHLTPQRRTEVGQLGPGTAQGEGGLLGLVMDPADGRRGYAYVTTATDNRVVTFTWDGTRVTAGAPILTGIPQASIHNGGRLAFGPDGFLYVTTGDAAQTGLAQDRNSLAGKILRITRDGAAAPGNPFGNRVFSYGHRNVQGLDWDREGRLWASEFGWNTWDELNLVRAGGNYGWPVVEGPSNDARFVAPVRWWTPAEMSPSGLTVLGDHVFMSAQRGTSLWEVPILPGTPRRLLNGPYGRIRTVDTIADGRLLITTSNGGGQDVVALIDPAGLRGEIQKKWYAQGGPQGFFGPATTGEICGLRDNGCVQLFRRGAIYWSPATGAHVSLGAIREAYARLGYENGFLGYPTSDELCGLRDAGCVQRFQHETGHLYWTPAAGAHFTRGRIHARYAAMGWENSALRYPTTDEICGIRDNGCFQRFSGERGHIYWSWATDAWAVQGEIFGHYSRHNWENGRFGYPTGPENCRNLPDARECTQTFQGGQITWNSRTGARG